MQYDVKTTKLTLKTTKATGISSSHHGSNIDGMGFNISFIALRRPNLAVKVIELYKEAYAIQEDDPRAPDEDSIKADEELSQLLGNGV